MKEQDITALTGAFDPSSLLTTFIGFSVFIMIVLGIIFGVQIVKWGVRKVAGRLGRGI